MTSRASVALSIAALGLLVGCGIGAAPSAGSQATPTPTPTSAPTQTSAPPRAASPSHRSGDHAAPALEALLPNRLGGVALRTASTSGAVIFSKFGDTAWANAMTAYLHSVGRTPADLRYAQVWDASKALDLDAGAFRLPHVSAEALRQAIIQSSRPGSMSLAVSTATIANKPVTAVLDQDSGLVLYLYDHKDVVFYVGGVAGGTGNDVVRAFLRGLP